MQCDDKLLSDAVSKAFDDIYEDFYFKLPDGWNIKLRDKRLRYQEIKKCLIKKGIPINIINKYYGIDSSIETDSPIIWLEINKNGDFIKKPLFLGEIKKQGTNDKRILEGKSKQSIGNAAADRVWKNYTIASDFCFNCDFNFFPYNVFLHGCDFDENNITKTTKGKLTPLFGELNILNPFFDKEFCWTKKGGSCFYQKNNFTIEQLYEICFKCCEIGLNYYLENKENYNLI